MKNLNEKTATDIQLIVKGMVAMFELNEPIEEVKSFSLSVVDWGHYFQVNYEWYYGEIPAKGSDPRYMTDARPKKEEDCFKIFKSESLDKLTREVNDMLEQVNEHKYDYELEAA